MLFMVAARRPLFVKICCITSQQEADLAIAAGADALGLVSHMPSGPGVIGDGVIADIAKSVAQGAVQASTHNTHSTHALPGQPIQTFLLTARQTEPSIAQQHLQCQTTHIQLVDTVAPSELLALRHHLPRVKLVQVIHVLNEASYHQALAVAPLVDMLLLDSGNPNLNVKELGGTGRTHDWKISAQIVDNAPVPVLLAGGLNPLNAADAVQSVRPYGLDICSGVRASRADGGLLDGAKLTAFIRAARRDFERES